MPKLLVDDTDGGSFKIEYSPEEMDLVDIENAHIANHSGGEIYTLDRPDGTLTPIQVRTGYVLVDKTINSKLSPERQLELLKNNLGVALKRIHNYRESLNTYEQQFVDDCVETLTGLTSIDIVR